jgi:hypothetical protein
MQVPYDPQCKAQFYVLTVNPKPGSPRSRRHGGNADGIFIAQTSIYARITRTRGLDKLPTGWERKQ